MMRFMNLTKEQKRKYIRDTKNIDKIIGLKDDTIYVSFNGYWHASLEFMSTCIDRNINVEVVL